MSIPELLVNDGFITPGDREKIENFSATVWASPSLK